MSRFSLALLPLLFGSALATQAAGPPYEYVKNKGNRGISGTVAGDLDKDGNDEIIQAGGTSKLRIFSWNAEKQDFDEFNLTPKKSFKHKLRDRFGNDLALLDINGDGWLDIIAPDSSNKGNDGGLHWFENPGGKLDGEWKFHTITEYSGKGEGNQTAHMGDLAVGDIDGNGHADIAARDISHGFWIFLRADDGKGWQERRFVATKPREGLALFDADGDGDLDIAYNGVWFETPSDPLKDDFTEHEYATGWYPEKHSVGAYATQVETADFNKDGRDDIAISSSEILGRPESVKAKPRGVRVYLTPKDPKKDPWQEIVLHDKWVSWHSLEIGDIDLDGDLDIVSGTSTVGQDEKDTPSVLFVFTNDGTGTKFTPVKFAEERMYQPSIGDVDGDGDLDLWAPNGFSSGPVRFFRNTAK